jgi:aspartyl-tRNA(Asn)/glutamyl-tRNA(Gln) amidotransferase subunit B
VLSVVELGLDGYVTTAVARGVAGALALARVANELAALENATSLDPDKVAGLLSMEQAGELPATQAKAVLAQLAAHGGDPKEIAAAMGFERLDDSALTQLVDGLIAAHPDEWGRYAEGDDKLAQFFVGQVMKLTKGQADGKAVIAELSRRR